MVVVDQQTSKSGNRKAGGGGKKGKIFVEDKSALISMMNGITDNQAAIAQAKVDKVKARTPYPDNTRSSSKTGSKNESHRNGSGEKGKLYKKRASTGADPVKKVQQGQTGKVAQNAVDMARVKADILAKAKEKKLKKQSKKSVQREEVGNLKDEKRRVGFA